MTIHNLDALFRPSSVAVVGASDQPGSVGTVVLRNLIDGGFRGPLLPVNPKYDSVAGRECHRSVATLPCVPDLALLCVPPAAVPVVARELVHLGTRAAIVLTAGLESAREADGARLDEALLESARAGGLRLLGPNCLGLLAPHAALNASFAHAQALPGKLAFVSQSGALCTAVLDWARTARLGFSAFVSLGEALDVDFGDVIDYLGSDPATSAILLYIESLGNARKFISASRAASRNKPLVAIKAGRAPAGERAAASHTRALAGSDEVYGYALRRAGVLRVDEIAELFAVAETLERVGPIEGSNLAILTNGGGPGVMATDTLTAGGGLLAPLSAATLAALDRVLPPTWSRANPVDVIGDAGPERYSAALRILGAAPEVDALLVLYSPTAMTSGLEVARATLAATRGARCKVLTSWLGRESTAAPRALLVEGGLATFDTPGDAVRAFLHMVRYREARAVLMQTPPSLPHEALHAARPERAAVRALVERTLAERRDWLGQPEALEVLAAYGLPVVATRWATDVERAVELAEELGFPVALKLSSRSLLHKSDVGGVSLDLETASELRAAAAAMRGRLARAQPDARVDGFIVQRMARRPGAYELFAGAAVDPIFGPFLVFGQGGTAVEVIADKAVALPPLDMLLAAELVERTRIARLLHGYRDRPAALMPELHRLLVRLSELVQDVPEIVELDVNPLVLDERGALVLDARIRVQTAAAGSGVARLAIRPYPVELEEPVELGNGKRLLLRPIRPEDEPAHRRLFARLDARDVRFRFFHLVRELPHSELARYTQIDYDREMAFVAVAPDAAQEDQLGVVRAVCDPNGERAEFAIVVAPEIAGQGLGRALLDKLIRYLRQRGVRVLVGRVLPENARMLSLARDLGFTMQHTDPAADVEVRLALGVRDRPPALRP